MLSTFDGVVMRSPVVSSLIVERLVGRVCWVDVPMALRMIDFSATFGFFDKHAKESLAVFETAGVSGVPHEVFDHLS